MNLYTTFVLIFFFLQCVNFDLNQLMLPFSNKIAHVKSISALISREQANKEKREQRYEQCSEKAISPKN